MQRKIRRNCRCPLLLAVHRRGRAPFAELSRTPRCPIDDHSLVCPAGLGRVGGQISG